MRDYERQISFDERCKDLSLDSDGGGNGVSLHEIFGYPADQEDLFERIECIEAVREGLKVLSDHDRQLLKLWSECHTEGGHRKGEGAVPEMSRRTGVPRTSLNRYLKDAKKRLAREVLPFVT
jgi:hypothetical protein